ncbi:MAG: MFS transporter [Oscillospiraceae bacterium]
MDGKVTYNRAKTWQIALFALNNTATNLFLVAMGYISIYANGIAGIATVLISTLLTSMRIFDGITDPIIGYIIDKTDTKFGKFRPPIILGYIILTISTLLMFNTLHIVDSNIRVIYFIGIYVIHIIGYTFQTACTKAAQACLTNDPKQRPTFSLYDGIYNTVLFTISGVYISNVLVGKKYGDFTPELFKELINVTVILAGICTLLAIVGIAKKDKKEFFGLGVESPKIKFRDYIDVIKSNRAIQMLIVAASTDKLANTAARNTIVVIVIYGVLAGDYTLSGSIAALMTPISLIVLSIGIQYARKLGQKKALVSFTWVAMIFAFVLGVLILFGDMSKLSLSNVNLFTVAYIVALIFMSASMQVSGNIVIPMIADCSDYETYRTGKYVPGMMGTLFSFVDKLISSLATTIVGFSFAAIGFKDKFPDIKTEYSDNLKYVAVALFIGLPIFGWICSLIAMKFYPLDSEKMSEIQIDIQRIKNEGSKKEKLMSV